MRGVHDLPATVSAPGARLGLVLRVLDLQETFDCSGGEGQQIEDDTVGQLVRIVRSVLRSTDPGTAADRVEHVAGQDHVQHLLDHH